MMAQVLWTSRLQHKHALKIEDRIRKMRKNLSEQNQQTPFQPVDGGGLTGVFSARDPAQKSDLLTVISYADCNLRSLLALREKVEDLHRFLDSGEIQLASQEPEKQTGSSQTGPLQRCFWIIREQREEIARIEIVLSGIKDLLCGERGLKRGVSDDQGPPERVE